MTKYNEILETNLRWQMRKGKLILQQGWIYTMDGDVEFKDVPTVDENGKEIEE